VQDPSAHDRRGASVRLVDVSRHFGDVKAVDNISLEIPAGSFFSLLGPSGCGKSTTLRIVSGFESPDSGSVLIGDEDVTSLDARKRPTAMVFQNYALFPHMTVGENVEYGLKVRKMRTQERRSAVLEALRRVDLEAFVDTPVTSLSGGQQQRTALARAVAIEPEVILFDEPLSNLDVALRMQTRLELKSLQHRLGLTSIYVTHDQEEALALSDQIAVMRLGKVVQVGSPQGLYNEPSTSFVASFLGGSNIVTDPSLVHSLTGRDLEKGKALAVRAEHLRIDARSDLKARVVNRQFLGMITELELELQGTRFKMRSTDDVGDESTIAVSISDHRFVIHDQ
jgi:ABC-type Fe3+/spermidine/putrescine transport system ATPase subunit